MENLELETTRREVKIDVDKIQTIEDVRNIFKFMDLHFAATGEECEEYKKYLILVKSDETGEEE
jgi:hypothetical protein